MGVGPYGRGARWTNLATSLPTGAGHSHEQLVSTGPRKSLAAPTAASEDVDALTLDKLT